MPSQARLFDVDPDLLSFVSVNEQPMAMRVAQVAIERVPPGRWNPRDLGEPLWGLLIVDGMVAREMSVAGSSAAELMGAGDVLYPAGAGAGELVPSESAWTVLEATRIAVLDDRLLPIASRWPGVTACLLSRAARRTDRLAVMQAICHLTRVDTRVLCTLWLLADRWGRVTPSGVVLPLRLTHRTLSRLVGARRPSVTSAITELGRRGLISRRTDGSWTLHGPPPEELERVGLPAEISAAPPTPRGERRPTDGPARPMETPAAMRSVVDQVRRLRTLYEQQHARALEAGRRSLLTRQRSQRLRDEARQVREGLNRPSDAPPSA